MKTRMMMLLICLVLIFPLCACTRDEKLKPASGSEAADTAVFPSGDISADFSAIEAANSYENLIAVYGCYKYTYCYNGEQSSREKYYDGIGTFIVDTLDNTAAYYTDDSYYVYRDGQIQAYLDAFCMNTPEGPGLTGSEFISDYTSEVQSIEKTDRGYLVTFSPNEEDAEFLLDDYVPGDSVVIYEAVNNDLTLRSIDKVFRRTDGTEESFCTVYLTQAEMPELGQQLRSHATPTDDGRAIATIISNPGTENEDICSTVFTKGDSFYIESYGYSLYDDPECTIPHESGTENNSGDFTIYALPQEISSPAYSEYRTYDADGNELYHEILWLGENGQVLNSDITEAPADAVIAYADYIERDENGNELYSQHTDFSEY